MPRSLSAHVVTGLLAVGLLVWAAPPASATFSGQGDRTLFTRYVGGPYDVRAIDPRTKKTPKVTNDGSSYAGSFSPNGMKMVFASNRGGDLDGEIYAANADGKHVNQLTDDLAGSSWPAWSPNGKRILYLKNGTGYVSIKASDGTGEHLIFNPGGAASFPPFWSPNGDRIGFSMDDGADVEVFTVKTDGSGLDNVTDQAGNQYLGDWAPNGNRIAFFGQDGSAVFQVFLINPDGTGQKQLTFGTANLYSPTYTADGAHLLYAKAHAGGSALFWMKRNGTRRRRLTNPGSGVYEFLQFVL